MDIQFDAITQILTNLARCMNIMGEITKIRNRMQQELTTINIEIAAVRNTQTALQNLMEGMAK